MLIRGHTLLYMRYFVHIHHTYIRYTYYLPSTHTYTLQSCCCARGGFRWSAPPGMDRFQHHVPVSGCQKARPDLAESLKTGLHRLPFSGTDGTFDV